MANTFFGFNTAINDHTERLGSSPEDIEGLEAEEEYDALNDETFGGLGDQSEVDWEVQHEQLAEIAESSKHGTDLESFLDHLGINDDEDSVISKDASVWAYNSDVKNGDKLNHSLLENSLKLLQPNLNQNEPKPHHMSPHQNFFGSPGPQPLHRLSTGNAQVLPSPKLRTVEDLERSLINQSKSPINYQQQHQNHALQQPTQQFQHGGHREMPRFPPGFQPMGMSPVGAPPPGMWHPMHQHHGHSGHPMPPPGMVRMLPPGGSRVPPPHMMQSGGPPQPPPGFMNHPYPHGPNFHMNPHFNFPPPPRVGGMPPNMMPNRGPGPYNNINNNINNKQQRPENYNNRGRPEYQSAELKDEYAGLMNNREKQWLLNIQLLQVNTGTPYFDDYYYTVFKERQAKNKENIPENRNNNNQRYHNNRYNQQRDGNVGHHHGNHRNSGQDNRQQQSQQQDQNPLNKKVYIPLQFENSLGKLQFGSITAPRKIIDMDIIQLEKDSDSTQTARDSRKTKQLLLELEALYSMILKAEDLKNPVAVSNTEKLMELKQKQRLREMEAAPTPEQKREVLKLLQEESVAPVENQAELLAKIVGALLQDEKLTSFVGIRKGKMLLLRVLPHLGGETYASQLLELWIKLLLSIPLIGRRDTIGDNILPRFHSHFKRFINVLEAEQILEILSSLVEIVKLENSRSTPLSHQSKPPLYFIVSNKFGISVIATILQRVATLLAAFTDKQTSDWSHFVTSLIDTVSLVATTPTPIEPIGEQQLNRLGGAAHLTADKLTLLEKTFVDSN